MSDNNDKKSDGSDVADYMKAMADNVGCSVTTVKDGWLLMFNTEWLQKQIESVKGTEFVIFVKSSVNSVKH